MEEEVRRWGKVLYRPPGGGSFTLSIVECLNTSTIGGIVAVLGGGSNGALMGEGGGRV